MEIRDIPGPALARLRRGMVIPAHPLALDSRRRLDEKYQRALTRYYIDAGVGGIAIGVHTTQFEIRDPSVGLYEPVLTLAAETIDDWGARREEPLLGVAGVCGRTAQAVREATLARELGFHAALLNLSALTGDDVPALLEHCREVARVLPVFGFYLQPGIGGRRLPYDFWRGFAEIENVLAIKIAAFNRYQTLDVVRAICDAGREREISIYTGNDDNIVVDLLTEYRLPSEAGEGATRIVGGLLGHWAVWTSRAVELLDEIHRVADDRRGIPPQLLTRAVEVTDMNAAIFDAAGDFAGCIPGIHEVLHRQGLMRGTWCLNPEEVLSPGQAAEIERICRAYPHLTDDDFVRDHRDTWLAG